MVVYASLKEMSDKLGGVVRLNADRTLTVSDATRFRNEIIDALVEAGTISPKDLDLFQYVETAEEAWKIISQVKPA